MGGGKQLVDWPAAGGVKPLVAAAFDAVAPVCDTVIVVVGHDAAAVCEAITPREFRAVESDPDGPMFDSICAGLHTARQIDPQADLLLHPGDHPEVARATLDALIQATCDVSSGQPVRAVMPEYQGRGGHPVLIPAALIDEILNYPGPGGLRQLWLDRPGLCMRLPVNDPTVVRDIDTPADYPGAKRLQ